MPQSSGQTATAESIAAEYLTWETPGGHFVAHLHRETMDGMARDILERSAGLPVETGGLLLGRAGGGERPVVWIERYQRIECRHSAGPYLVLDEEDQRLLADSLNEVESSGEELKVVGIFRSHLRPGFQLEPADCELADRFFRRPEDLFLLIRPLEGEGHSGALLGQFFLRERTGATTHGNMRPAHPSFPFSGSREPLPNTASDPPEVATGRTVTPAPVPVRPRQQFRRLVPDFAPLPEPRPLPAIASATEELNPSQGFLRRRWPALAAVLLVGAGMAVFVQQASHREVPAAVEEPKEVRPLGLYVDPSGTTWRISWNASATALKDARGVKLFVRDGDDQNLIELAAQDLQSGTYQYQAKGPDVTFRLEVTDSAGKVSAESFRLLKSTEEKAAEAPVKPPPAPPQAIRRVAPTVPASIRPRIVRPIPIDIRVGIDARGRVISAVAVKKNRSGLESYLTTRAIDAAKQWRFESGPGAEVIHFSFEK